MTGARERRRAFAVLVALGVANHTVLSGARVAVSLEALSRGASPATVGLLVALFALLPMLSAVALGRFSDRIGAKRPMAMGSACLALSTVLPALWPGFASLFAAAVLIGFSFTTFMISLQQVTGELGEPRKRAKRFSLLALAYSVSGMLGPLVAGFGIDHVGYRMTFAMLALVPLAPLAVLLRGRLPIPAPVVHEAPATPRGMFDLVRNATLRRLLAINAMFTLGWDLHTVFVPIYGSELGLTASEIGTVLATFGLATFVVRFAMPRIAARAGETQVLAGALFLSAAAYLAFPFAGSAATLAALSFALGFGLGSGQPMVMSLLSSRAPPGRMGEAAGLRMSLGQTMSVAVPLAFGALGGAIGLFPVFWGVGACLVTGGVVARRGA